MDTETYDIRWKQRMEMLKSKNLSSHTYNPAIADDIADKILHLYFAEFTDFRTTMKRYE